MNITFVQLQTFGGSQFPATKLDHAFVSESGPTYALGQQITGKRISEFKLDANGNVVGSPTAFVEYVGTGRATVVGLAAGPDGLYFTELYKDQNAVTPIDAGARVFRVRFAPAGNGDFNGDGSVNGADYIVWRKSLGTTGIPAFSGADGDGDTTVDQDDLGVWRSHFGQMVGAGSGSGAGLVVGSGASVEGEVGSAEGVVRIEDRGSSGDESAVVKTSVGLSVGEPQRINGDEQAAIRRENPPLVLAPASSPFTRYRPAGRRSPGAVREIAASRDDEALVAWLATQPDTKKQFEDLDATESWASEDVNDTDDVYIDSVEQVFAQLAYN